MTQLTENIIREIAAVPRGKVASYGKIAELAGNARAARQVVRVLHSYSGKMNLPWQRIVGKDGSIRLSPGAGLEEQASLLQGEGIDVSISRNGRSAKIDLKKYSI